MRKQIIRIKLLEKCTNKLVFVKLIKDCSVLGLKESKDVCDSLHNYPGVIQNFEARQDNTGINYAKKFRDEIVNCGGKFIISGGTDFMRNFKILDLGIGDNEDYANFIVDYYENNFEDQKEFLKFVLSKLNREDLMSIFEKSKETYKEYILD
jgi:hypothetical protein